METLNATSVLTGARLLKSNSIVEETLDDSDPASLGAGDEHVLVFVEPKPESQNISFSRISFGKASNPSVEELSKLEEEWITFLEEVLLMEVVELLSLKHCCMVEEEVEEVFAVLGASVIAAPSFLGALIVNTPSFDSAVETWSMSAAGGSVNSL